MSNKNKLNRLSLVLLISTIVVYLIAFYVFHFVTDNGLTLTFHEEAEKPLVSYMFAIFGTLCLFSSFFTFVYNKIVNK